MATSLVVARLVGPSVLGTIAYGLAFVSVFTFVCDFGTGTAHMRLIAEGRDEIECNGTFLQIKLVLVTAFTLIVIGAFALQKYYFKIPFESKAHEIIILLYLIIVTINQLVTILTTHWAAKMEQAKQDIPSFIQTVLYQILRVILAVIGFKAIALVVGNLFSVLIILPLYYYIARGMKFGSFNKSLFKEYVTLSLPVIVVIICQTLIFSLDKVILQNTSNSKEVGLYSAAFVLGSFVQAIEGSTGLLFFPYFSKHISLFNWEKVNFTLRKYERTIFSFVLPIGLAAAVFSDLMISITYGKKFLGSEQVFSIIIISFLVSLTNLPYINIITGFRLFKIAAWIWVINVLFFLGFCYVFVSPKMLGLGGRGMALSLLCTNIVSLAQYQYQIWRRKDINRFPGWSIVLFNIIYFTAVYLIYSRIISHSILFKLSGFIISLAVFLGLSIILKIVKKEELKVVLEIVNLEKMKHYIKHEIFKHK